MTLSKKDFMAVVGKWKYGKKEDCVQNYLEIRGNGDKLIFRKVAENGTIMHAVIYTDCPEFSVAVFMPEFITAVKIGDREIFIEFDGTLTVNGIKISIADKEIPVSKGLPEFTEFTLDAEQTSNLLTLVCPHVSSDMTRYFMNGVNFESSVDGFRAIATDGRTLAMQQIFPAGNLPEFSMVVPVQTVNFLPVQTEFIVYEKFYTEIRQIQHGYAVTYFIPTIDGDFPPYRRVLPVEREQYANFLTAEMLIAIKKACEFIDKKSKRLVVEISCDSILLKTSKAEFRVHAQSSIAISFAVSIEFLQKSINKNSTYTRLEFFDDSIKMLTVEDVNVLRLIMPMQV